MCVFALGIHNGTGAIMKTSSRKRGKPGTTRQGRRKMPKQAMKQLYAVSELYGDNTYIHVIISFTAGKPGSLQCIGHMFAPLCS